MKKANPLLIVNPLRKPVETTKLSTKQEQLQFQAYHQPANAASTVQPQFRVKFKTGHANQINGQTFDKFDQIISEEFVPQGEILSNRHRSLQVKNYDPTQSQHLRKRRKSLSKNIKKEYKLSIEPKERLSSLVNHRLSAFQSFQPNKKVFYFEPQQRHKSIRLKNLPISTNLSNQLSEKEISSLLRESSSLRVKQDNKLPKKSVKTVHIINYTNIQRNQIKISTAYQWNRLEIKKLQKHLIQPCYIKPATLSKRLPTTTSTTNQISRQKKPERSFEERRRFSIRNRKAKNEKEIIDQLEPWTFEKMEESDQINY